LFPRKTGSNIVGEHDSSDPMRGGGAEKEGRYSVIRGGGENLFGNGPQERKKVTAGTIRTGERMGKGNKNGRCGGEEGGGGEKRLLEGGNLRLSEGKKKEAPKKEKFIWIGVQNVGWIKEGNNQREIIKKKRK